MKIYKEIISRDNSRNIGDTQYRKEIVTQLGVRIIILILPIYRKKDNSIISRKIIITSIQLFHYYYY